MPRVESPRLPELDEVVGEDDGDADDELVLDEDEEVDGNEVGETRGNMWGAASVAGRGGAARVSGSSEQGVGAARSSGSGAGGAATAVLEVGDEEPNSVTKTMRGRWRSRAERGGACHGGVNARGRRSRPRVATLRPEGATQRRRLCRG